MMKVVIIVFSLISFCLMFFVYYFHKRYMMLKNDVKSITKAIRRVRYGDINVRVDNLNDKHLEMVSNRLIETINDREAMIKEYQTTLSKKNLSLEEIIKNEKQLRALKEEFTATLAHDMKVPVIAELNSINYMLEGRFGNINEKQTQVLKLMQSSNQELKELIENLLEIYKLEEKGLILNKSFSLINPLLENIISEMKLISEKKLNDIVYDISATEDIKLYYDEFQIKRVLKNIIQNAIINSPNSTNINIDTYKSDKFLEIRVTNTGNNISKEDVELIFQKFYTGHSKFNKAGTGLGLYLSRQIMLAHKGDIKVNSSIKDKITFTITIPL